MSDSVDLFVKNRVPEEAVVTLLGKLTPQGVESVEFANPKSSVFLQYLDYECGFLQGLQLAWADEGVNLDDVVLAVRLAKEFCTDVLLQPRSLRLPYAMEWCLVTESGELYAVDVQELADGVDVKKDGARIRIDAGGGYEAAPVPT